MAYKQIYIKDVDLPLFEEAERYGDSLSRVISEALKDFVAKKRKELDAEGFGEIEISIGLFPGQVETKKFIGKILSTCREKLFAPEFFEDEVDETYVESLIEQGWVVRRSPTDEEIENNWTIFGTKKGKFILWNKSTKTGLLKFLNKGSTATGAYWILDSLPGPDKNYELIVDDIPVPSRLIKHAITETEGKKEEWLDL